MSAVNEIRTFKPTVLVFTPFVKTIMILSGILLFITLCLDFFLFLVILGAMSIYFGRWLGRGIWEWLTTTITIGKKKLKLSRSLWWFFRNEKNINYTTIVDIELTQKFIEKLLGIARVVVNTNNSKKNYTFVRLSQVDAENMVEILNEQVFGEIPETEEE